MNLCFSFSSKIRRMFENCGNLASLFDAILSLMQCDNVFVVRVIELHSTTTRLPSTDQMIAITMGSCITISIKCTVIMPFACRANANAYAFHVA